MRMPTLRPKSRNIEPRFKQTNASADQLNMIDMKAVERSKKFYEEAKIYFASQKLPDCVIEISFQKPMNEWTIYFTPTDEMMKEKRRSLLSLNKPYIAIYVEPEGTYFFFTDSLITNSEILETKELILSNIKNPDEYDLDSVAKEFLQLKKLLQNT